MAVHSGQRHILSEKHMQSSDSVCVHQYVLSRCGGKSLTSLMSLKLGFDASKASVGGTFVHTSSGLTRSCCVICYNYNVLSYLLVLDIIL